VTRWEDAAHRVRESLRGRIVGMDDVIEKVLICILTRNHALLVGVPGLAKTLLVSSLAEVLDLTFARIQFTPDLMPTDITGTEVLTEDRAAGLRTFRFLPGPIFASIILADEINRTPPKTQSALMEAMEERQVTSVGKRYPLPDPFLVLATQNPIDMEGTYPLPVAQLDRFMFRIRIEYPEEDVERRVARRTSLAADRPITPVLAASDISTFAAEMAAVTMPPPLRERVVGFVRRSRPEEPAAPGFVREWVAFGASPRAAQALGVAARARALLHGRDTVQVDDVTALAPDIVRHRLVLNYHAVAEGIRAVDVVQRLMTDHFDLGSQEPAERRPLWRRLLRL
jgi:MoxR-like ATPase